MDVYPIPVEADKCAVVDSGQLVVVDGLTFYYARYEVTSEVPFWPELRDVPPCANSLVIFVGQENGDYARIYRSYSEDLSEFQRLSFPAPVVVDTPRGKVLNIQRRDMGGGMYQWFNDEYWIWQWNDWQRLDVTSWYEEVDTFVPSGYTVGGVASDFFDLVNLKNVSPVRRMDDPECCPSAGIVTVSFEWVDQALRIRSATYDPDTDFRSLWP